jgi:hypothetical protein
MQIIVSHLIYHHRTREQFIATTENDISISQNWAKDEHVTRRHTRTPCSDETYIILKYQTK